MEGPCAGGQQSWADGARGAHSARNPESCKRKTVSRTYVSLFNRPSSPDIIHRGFRLSNSDANPTPDRVRGNAFQGPNNLRHKEQSSRLFSRPVASSAVAMLRELADLDVKEETVARTHTLC